MDAAEMFLTRHHRMHAHVARLTEGLTEAEIRSQAHPLVNPLAWLLWHVARAEDSAVNLLVTDGAEVLDEAWCARLRVARRDVGPGMSMDDVRQLSRAVDLPSLAAYWGAVGIRTTEVVALLRPEDLDEVVGAEAVHRTAVRSATPLSQAPLEALWQGITRGHALVWLPLAHNCEHIGQADLIRGMLGHPGRF